MKNAQLDFNSLHFRAFGMSMYTSIPLKFNQFSDGKSTIKRPKLAQPYSHLPMVQHKLPTYAQTIEYQFYTTVQQQTLQEPLQTNQIFLSTERGFMQQ